MLIALLALLGVNLLVIVVVAASMLARRRWVMRRPGAFRGAIRVADGMLDGIAPKWRRGYGRWVRDVLVWTKGPLLVRNEFVPADGLHGRRTARPDELRRLGRTPAVMEIVVGDPLAGPYREIAGATAP